MIHRKYQSLFVGTLLILIALLLSACMAIPPSVAVEGLALYQGGSGDVIIRIYNLNDIQSIQVGPQGKFTFDPLVVEVSSVDGMNGFEVFSSAIDNTIGEVLFLAGYPGGGRSAEGIVKIRVKAIGDSKTETIVTLTKIDVLADKDGHAVTAYEITGGMVKIR